MSTDRELLELAAKAAGIELADIDSMGGLIANTREDGPRQATWNPLTDDGDALRLAVKRKLIITFADGGSGPHVCVGPRLGPFTYERLPVKMFALDEECAATRRAIVCAAAAIGEKMP
jgi:hypothetical protein